MDFILYFYLFSFFGWILETVYASLLLKKYVSKQTLLKSPLCPIYGIGALALIITLYTVRESAVLLFCGGFFVAGAVEYFIAVFYEKMFGVKWWDYNNKKGNIDGKICVSMSIVWGFLTVAFFRIIFPFAEMLIRSVNSNLKLVLCVFFTVYVFTDYKKTFSEIKKCKNEGKDIKSLGFAALKKI